MLGFQSPSFPHTFEANFKLYNDRPFDVGDLFRQKDVPMIKSALQAVKAGHMNVKTVNIWIQRSAEQILMVLQLNRYVQGHKITNAKQSVDDAMRTWLSQQGLRNDGNEMHVKRWMLFICGEKAHYESNFKKLYEQWRKKMPQQLKVWEEMMSELYNSPEGKMVAEKSPQTDPGVSTRIENISLGLGRSGVPLIVVLLEKLTVDHISNALGVSRIEILGLLSELYKVFLFLNRRNEEFVENEQRYYSRLRENKEKILKLMKVESQLLGDSIDDETRNRMLMEFLG